jgi:putative transposase
MTKDSPFKWFKTSPEIIRLAVMMYVRFPLSLRNVEDLLHERGVEISHETVRFWWRRLGPLFAAEIRKRRIEGMKSSHWRWHLDEMFVKINGERHYLWRPRPSLPRGAVQASAGSSRSCRRTLSCPQGQNRRSAG